MKNGITDSRETILKLRGEWMFGQCYACLTFVVFQGNLEEHL